MSGIITTKLKLIKNYEFKVSFGSGETYELLVDEKKPIGEGKGPSPTQLLSTAIGHCLGSSLIFCLKKAQVQLEALETTVETDVSRNEEGRLRVNSINAKIHLKVSNETQHKLPTCLRVFKNYCTVTQSVIKGIPVNVSFI